MRQAGADGERGRVLGAEDDRAVLRVGLPHPVAEGDEVLVGIDDAPLDHLGGPCVITTLVEGHPAALALIRGLKEPEGLGPAAPEDGTENPTAHTVIGTFIRPVEPGCKKRSESPAANEWFGVC